MKIPVLALAASRAPPGHIAKPKPKIVDKESLNSSTSKMKAVAAMQRNFRKIVPRKGALQPQTSIKPRLSETASVDEIATNQALGVRDFLRTLS